MKLRISELCKEKKITQKKLAEMAGMSPVGFSVSINGNPTKDTLEKIAAALNVSITELFEPLQNNYIVCPHCKKNIKISE